MLIGRLHPPACEAADNTFQLETFVPLIRMCGSSSVLKTRQLAALALTPLLTASSFVTVLQQLFDDVTQATPHNKLHGALLQVPYLKQSSYSSQPNSLSRMTASNLKFMSLIESRCCSKGYTYIHE